MINLFQLSQPELIEELLKLKKENELLKDNKKYGIIWEEDKTKEQFEYDLEGNFPVLQEISEKFIFYSNDLPTNILIEGDNYHSLTSLLYTHKERIDVIYIDPPYNTGSKDFIYNDLYVDKEDTYKHSKWLSFMKKRLIIAKELLSSSGIIYISIDDNEQSQLKLLCDEVFGEENQLNPIIWLKGNAQNDAEYIQKNHEYILCYKKGKVKIKDISITKKEVFTDENGYFVKGSSITTGGEGGTLNSRPNLGYSIYFNPITQDKIAICDYDIEKAKTFNNEKEIYTTNKSLLEQGYKVIRPPKKGSKLGCWTWGLDTFNSNKNSILISSNKDGFSVIKKKYIDTSKIKMFKEKNKIFIEEIKEVPPKSFIEINSSNGTKAIMSIFDDKVFNNSKPIELIKYLISLVRKEDMTILDFFAGSGTTGQAVLELNKENNSNHKFILCTNNENNICEQVTYNRLSRVINGYKDFDSLRCNLKYYKTFFISKSKSKDELKKEIATRSCQLLCVKEGVFEEIECNNRYNLYKTNNKILAIYHSYNDSKLDELREKLNNYTYDKILYCFTFENEINLEEFKEWKNVSVKPIPQKILEIFEEVCK